MSPRMVFTLAAIEAETPMLTSIEAELDLIRLHCAGYTSIAGVAMRGDIPATASQTAELRLATARFEHLVQAAAHLRSEGATSERTVNLSVDCALCGTNNRLTLTHVAHQDMVKWSLCGEPLGLVGTLVAATWQPYKRRGASDT